MQKEKQKKNWPPIIKAALPESPALRASVEDVATSPVAELPSPVAAHHVAKGKDVSAPVELPTCGRVEGCSPFLAGRRKTRNVLISTPYSRGTRVPRASEMRCDSSAIGLSVLASMLR